VATSKCTVVVRRSQHLCSAVCFFPRAITASLFRFVVSQLAQKEAGQTTP
jgi:hypothetical protein